MSTLFQRFLEKSFPRAGSTDAPASPADHDNAQSISPWVLQQIVASSPFGTILVDVRRPDMPIIYVNAAFEQLTGYTAAEAVGRNARFLQGEDREQEGRWMMRQAIEKGEACTVVLRNYRKDGMMFWNEMHLAPIRDPQGQVTHYIARQQDITTRREAELALARSEARYHQIFDSHSAVKLVADPNTGRLVDANAAAADFYGYSREQLRTMYLQDIHTLSDPEVRSRLQRAAAQERTHYETQHRLASGAIRDVDVYVSPVDTPEGRFNYAIVVDVTAKRQAERRYRSLFEQSNDAVFHIDLNGDVLQANARAAEMLGYSPEELTGLGYCNTVEPAQQSESAQVVQRLLAGERLEPYQRVFRRKDGSALYGEINIQLMRDLNGTPLFFQSIVRDITRRRQMEEALRQSEERLRVIVDSIPIMISIFDAVGRVQYANPSWIKHLEWTAEELAAFEDPLSMFFPDPAVRRQALAYMLSGQAGWRDFEVHTKSGQIIDSSWANVRLSDGRSIGFGQDITERKLAEARAFELALEKERMKLVTRFIEVAAHEFRTPLAIIGTAAYMLTRLEETEARQRKGEVIDSQLRRITTLIDMLLLLVKLETADTSTLLPVRMPLLLLAQQRRCLALYGDRPVLHVEAPADQPPVLGNADLLDEVLKQLLDNAYRFTPADGQIAVTAGVLDGHIWVEVADTGLGIAPDELPHVFETFWRRDQTHSTAGFGLGLSIVRRVVQLHGGAVDVESTAGQGSRFRITLPVHDSPVRPT